MRLASIAMIALLLAVPNIGWARDCLDRATEKAKKGQIERAAHVLRVGATKGDERCQFVFAMWSLSGRGTRRNENAGARWLKKAALEGLPIAQSNLGLLYASGVGVEQDKAKAAEWYRKAAEHGDSLGQAAYGTALFLGSGVEQDRLEAFVWTSLAAEQGEEKAKRFLDEMRNSLTQEQVEEAMLRVERFRASVSSSASRWRPTANLYDARDSARAHQRQIQRMVPR